MPPIGPSQASTFLDIPIFNAMFPKEGAKAVPVPLNFGTQQSYNVDLTILQQRGYLKVFQSVYIDNKDNNVPLTVQIAGSNQRVTCPGASQGVFPIFVPASPIFTVTCAGSNVSTVFFSNVPLPASVWSATQSPLFNASGYMEVTDVALDGCISSGNVAVAPNLTGNNNVLKPFFAADELFTGSTATSTAQTITTGAPSFFITDVFVALTASATIAAPGDLTVTIKDDATTILQGIATLKGAATTDQAPLIVIESRGLQYNSKGTTKALTLTLGAALTAGLCYWNIAGGLCSNVGP